MFQAARLIASLWTQRWRALRTDEGATAMEYTILVLMGFLAAGAVATIVANAIESRDSQIK